jgi:F420-dependent oxidoreductase-like protein
MSNTQRLRFGLMTAPQFASYEDLLRVWQEADAIPLMEHAWTSDHFLTLHRGDPTGPCLEGWTLLAALAARTERLRLGVMVTGNTYRHPAVLAKMAITVDIISHGRLEFGIGAGWYEQEHTAYGIPLYTPSERIRRLEEACEVIRRLWTEDVADFGGSHYQLHSAHCQPKPIQRPHPPLLIGGSGEQLTLRVVARYANIWNYDGEKIEEFQHKCEVLDNHCAAIGRNPATIERSVKLGIDPAALDQTELTTLRDQLRGFIDAGATHLVFSLRAPYPEGIVRCLADELISPFVPRVM